MNDVLKNSYSSPTQSSLVNTHSLQKPESSHCDIDSDVLKFILDQVIDKCDKLTILHAELNTKLVTERESSEKRGDNSPVENLDTCSCTTSSQKLTELEEKLFDLDCRVIECQQYPRRL